MGVLDPPACDHPWLSVLGRVESARDDARELPVWFLDTAGADEVLRRLVALESRMSAARLAVLAHSEVVDVAGLSGAPDIAARRSHRHGWPARWCPSATRRCVRR